MKARRGDVQLDSGWVHIRGTKRAARDRHILVRHPALASLGGPMRFSAQGRNRTTDTGIFSPLLYRLSYLGV